MILEYHRPKSLEEAIDLLNRVSPVSVPLGGGTFLSQNVKEAVAVVDLQAVGLDRIEIQGNSLLVGATVTLQQLSRACRYPASAEGCAPVGSHPQHAQLCDRGWQTGDMRRFLCDGYRIVSDGRAPGLAAG